ncbi:MAG: transposase [Myxococcales bacterium]|nr:MAG: transposase [Myxococcales bacterium]
MKTLRRLYVEGGTYAFTVIADRRREILTDPVCRTALREAVARVRERRPFEIVAWVLLPDHLHCIWTLPDGDYDFSTRWSLIKRSVSYQTKNILDTRSERTPSQTQKGESGLWQHRFWEHRIRNERDLAAHFDYIHFNPVKHGLVETPARWPWSTYHKYCGLGYYDEGRTLLAPEIEME